MVKQADVEAAIREQFARYGAQGGEKAAERMSKKERVARAKKAGLASAAARAKKDAEQAREWKARRGQ